MNELPIQIKGIVATRTGLEIPDGSSIEDWATFGKQLCAVNEGIKWCIGDWINFGEAKYGEKYATALSFFGKEVLGGLGYEYETLRTFASVCGSVALLSRNNKLSFNHHKAVAPMLPQDQAKWLGMALQNEWSVKELRQAIKDSSGEYANEISETRAFNTLAWSDDGLRYFKRELDSRPIADWPNDRLTLIAKDLEPLASIYSLFKGEIQKRGLLPYEGPNLNG